jgi:cysteine synthase B
MPNQYENEQNVRAHELTTGPELWRQTEGRITHLFLSLGTCGTVTGVARSLRVRNPEIKVIAVQPSEGHDVPGLRNVSELEVTKLFDPSLIEPAPARGWSSRAPGGSSSATGTGSGS